MRLRYEKLFREGVIMHMVYGAKAIDEFLSEQRILNLEKPYFSHVHAFIIKLYV